ncbi:hypothetical protein R1flu_029032 [Riccia fluitans]|uniref:Uncharacterized protein n=1 Tax=Riccia fluitans TaxID=41844 RepID=A0ABD1XNF4_9MARC
MAQSEWHVWELGRQERKEVKRRIVSSFSSSSCSERSFQSQHAGACEKERRRSSVMLCLIGRMSLVVIRSPAFLHRCGGASLFLLCSDGGGEGRGGGEETEESRIER